MVEEVSLKVMVDDNKEETSAIPIIIQTKVTVEDLIQEAPIIVLLVVVTSLLIVHLLLMNDLTSHQQNWAKSRSMYKILKTMKKNLKKDLSNRWSTL